MGNSKMWVLLLAVVCCSCKGKTGNWERTRHKWCQSVRLVHYELDGAFEEAQRDVPPVASMQEAGTAGWVMECFSGDAYLQRVEGELSGLFEYGSGVALGRPASGYDALIVAVSSLPDARDSVAHASRQYLSLCPKAWTADVRSRFVHDLRARHAKAQKVLGKVIDYCVASGGITPAH